jgi:hypothetical protein
MLSVLGVALLATFALGVGTAQAHEWNIKGIPLSKWPSTKTSIAGSSSETILFNWSALEGSLNWRCATPTESGTIEVGGVSQVTIGFGTCKFVAAGLAPCTITSISKPKVSTKVAEVTVEGKPRTYEVYTTLAGNAFEFTIRGESCTIAGGMPWAFSGSFAAQLDGVERVSQPKAFSKANQVQGGFLLGQSKTPLYMEGSWNETLGGEQKGLAWLLN